MKKILFFSLLISASAYGMNLLTNFIVSRSQGCQKLGHSNLYDMESWYGTLDVSPEYDSSRNNRDDEIDEAALANPGAYPPYMIAEANAVEVEDSEDDSREIKKEMLKRLRYPFKNKLYRDMQDAVRDLNYEGAAKCLQGVDKLTASQTKIIKAFVKNKREALNQKRGHLKDNKMKAEYADITFNDVPKLDKISALISSKIDA